MKYIIILLFSLVTMSYSINYHYIDSGDDYWINGFMNNNEHVVVVRKLDYPNVKVRDIKTKEIKIVSATVLLTKKALDREETKNTLMFGLLVGCSINKDCREAITEKGLEICNETHYSTLFISIGKWDNSKIRTKGWYNIERGKCKKVLKNKLEYISYYIHVENNTNDNNLLENDTLFCINYSNAFNIFPANTACRFPNKKAYFHKINTGKTSEYFKYTLR